MYVSVARQQVMQEVDLFFSGVAGSFGPSGLRAPRGLSWWVLAGEFPGFCTPKDLLWSPMHTCVSRVCLHTLLYGPEHSSVRPAQTGANPPLLNKKVDKSGSGGGIHRRCHHHGEVATQQKTAERDGMLFSLNTNLSCSCCSLRSEAQQCGEIDLKSFVSAMGFFSNLNIKKKSEMNMCSIFSLLLCSWRLMESFYRRLHTSLMNICVFLRFYT